ncbi:MAG TPA: hypothetical protein VIH42_12865, partial [Thermoguttaceae bacterium]
MPSTDLPDQDAPQAEARVSAETDLPVGAARRFADWVKAHRVKAAIAMGTGILCVTALIAGWALFLRQTDRMSNDLVTLEKVLGALDRGAFAETQTLAKSLQKQGTLSVEELGWPAFALGATAAYEAENSQGKERIRLFLLAARYLEEANNRGFPADRQGEGLYLLGKSLYESGQIQACRSVLFSALKASDKYREEIHALLANSYLNDPTGKLEQALEQNTLRLADKNLSDEKQHEALLQRAQILLRMGKIEECNTALDQIPEGAKDHVMAVV